MARRRTSGLGLRPNSRLAGVLAMLGTAVATPASAQIATDGTMGPAQVLGGLDVTIPSGLGTAANGNLFHSFSDFNIATGGSATFDGPGAFANVISRVTGGSISNIDGLLRSNIGTSGFFFINPSGVAFGPNASIDVPGAFHVSTADRILFPDGGVFDATDPANTILSVAEPSAFGFLDANPAAIGPLGDGAGGTLPFGRLEVASGQTLSLVGGGIAIEGGAIDDPAMPGETLEVGRLSAPSGTVNLVSVASAGQVSLTPNGPALSGFGALGPIEMTDEALVSTKVATPGTIPAPGDPTGPGGTIYIRGGELVVDNSAAGGTSTAINSGTTGAADGAPVGIDIRVTGEVSLANAEVLASSFGEGRSGDIRIEAGGLRLLADETPGSRTELGAGIASRVFGSGPSGDIHIDADTVDLAANAVISTQVTSVGTGQAGNITIETGALNVDGSVQSAAIDSFSFGGGAPGAIAITADTATFRGGPGFAGVTTQISSDSTSVADAGPITLSVGRLELLDGAQINASVFAGPGNGGDIRITADSMLADGIDVEGFAAGVFASSESVRPGVFPSGDSGTIDIEVGELTLRERGLISTFSNAFGDSGAVNVVADTLSVASGGQIGATSFGLGRAGSVTVEAGSIDLAGPSPPGLFPFFLVPFTGITSISGIAAAGGGTVTVTASERLSIREGAQINAQTSGLGDGGEVVVEAADLTISGFDPVIGRASGIVTDTSVFPGFDAFALGRAGEIEITVGSLQVLDRGIVSSLSSSFGDAGSVAIVAESATVSGDALVSTASTLPGSTAAAGTVTLEAASIEVLAGATVSSSTRTEGAAGTVTLSGEALSVDAGRVSSETDGFAPAGAVSLAADRIELRNLAFVTTSTGGLGDGDAGSVSITGDTVLIDGSVITSDTFGLAADAGAIAIEAAQTLVASGSFVATSTFETGAAGSVSLTADSLVIDGTFILSETGGLGPAGLVSLEGSQVSIANGSTVGTSTFAGGPAGSVSLQAGTLLIDDSRVESDTFGAGAGGNVFVAGQSITLSNEGAVTAISRGAGAAGTIEVSATDLTLVSGGQIAAQARSSGEAGDIVIDATGDVVINGFLDSRFPSGLFADARSDAADGGDGGSISVTAGRLDMSDIARINARTFGGGSAGSVTLNVGEVLVASDAGIRTDTFGSGTAGSIVANVDTLTLRSGGRVSSRSFGTGDGGSIEVRAATAVDIAELGVNVRRSSISTEAFSSGDGGNIGITAPLLQVTDSALVVADSFGDGNAGNIALDLGALVLRDGGAVSSAAQRAGDGGSIAISASAVEIAGGSGPDGRRAGIFGDALSSGSAGEISLNTGTLNMSERGFITSGSRGTGDGGAISIVSGTLVLTGGAEITATTEGSGVGGDITIAAAGRAALSGDGTGIFAESTSAAPEAGTAGSIALSTGRLEMTAGAEISTQSARADGGNIQIRPASFLLVQDSRITTSVGTGEGGGGNVTVGPALFAILERGTIQANAFGGPGGNILIVANSFIATPDSIVEASSQLGINGTVSIVSPDTDVSTGVVVLSDSLANAAARLAQQCGARGGRTLASFVGVGRGGLPAQPGSVMPSHYLAADSPKLSGGAREAVARLAALPAGADFVPATLQIACST